MRTLRSLLAPCCATPLALLAFASAAHALTSATWLAAGTGSWSDPTKWDSNPLHPCNGNGGESFDVTIANGSVTLDLDCSVEAFTFSGGTLGGDFDLSANQLLTWSGGTLAGNGTTQAAGGAAFSGSGTKLFGDTRTLDLTGGAASWSAGSISLGPGGATLRNQVDLTATGATGRSLNDTGNTGSFLNEGPFTLALASASNVLTLAPGTLGQSSAVHVDTGILVLAPTTGSYTGSFDGAGSLRFSGGTQTLASGSSVTVADAEVTGGTLSVSPGAGFAVGNLDLQVGSFSVTDAATTATAGTATQLSGTLTGAGTLETSGLLTWSGGTMSGSGTTRAQGGLTLSGTATKLFDGTRSLRIAGGSATWSAGSINLGPGGATLRNQVAFTATGPTGRSLSDTSDTGSFLNEGTFTLALDSPANQLTLSPGTLTHSGTLDLVTGTLQIQGSFTQTAGAIRLSGGTLTTPISTDLDIQGGAVEGSGRIESDVQCACVIAPGFSTGQIELDGDLTLVPGAELRAEIAGLAQGTSYDFVPVSGTGSLAGSLTVSFLSGFENSIGPADQLTLLEASAPLTGSFANVSSGERVISLPGLDSMVVSYGAGSPTGAQRVVLRDFRAFAPAAVFEVGGTAQGGSITLTLAGIEIVVTTSAGQTPEEIAAAIADAINANGSLARLGIAGIATGDTLETNAGLQEDPLVSDPGIGISFVQNVPALPALALALLALLLGGLGARYARSPA